MRLQRVYLYLAALLSLLALAFGLINATSNLIYLWFAPNRPSISPLALLGHGAVLPWLIWSVVAALLWGAHWLLANRVARTLTIAGAEERNAPERKAYLYIGQFVLLALMVVEAILFFYNAALPLLGQPATTGLDPWPARALAPVVSAAIALAFWIHLRRVTLGDGDFGHEAGAGGNWRRAYYYLAMALATVMLVAGAGEFLSAFLRLAGQMYAFGGQAVEARSWQLGAAALATTLVAIPLTILLWRAITHIALDDVSGVEINAISRKLLLYGGRVAGAALTLISLGFLVWQLLLILLGQFPADARAFWEEQLTPALAYLPVGIILWAAYGSAGRNDVNWADETRESAVMRRLYYYLLAAFGLGAFWYGAQALLVLFLLLAFGIWPGSLLFTEQARRFFSLTAVLAVIGGPVWWAHWRPQQTLARQPGPVGYDERSSLLRRIFLYGVVAAAVLVVVVTLGSVIFQAPGWLFGPRTGVSFVQSLIQLGVAIAIALSWWIGHGFVLRADQRMNAEEELAAGYDTSAEPYDVIASSLPAPVTVVDTPPAAPVRSPAITVVDTPQPESTEPSGVTIVETPPTEQVPSPAVAPDVETPPAVEPPRPPYAGRRPASSQTPEPPSRGLHFERDALRASLESSRPSGDEGVEQATPPEPALPITPSSRIVVVVDGADGVLGRDLLAGIHRALPDVTLLPVPLNQQAQQAMSEAVDGREFFEIRPDTLAQAAVIVGASDMIVGGGPNSEVPLELGAALAASPARKVLVGSPGTELEFAL